MPLEETKEVTGLQSFYTSRDSTVSAVAEAYLSRGIKGPCIAYVPSEIYAAALHKKLDAAGKSVAIQFPDTPATWQNNNMRTMQGGFNDMIIAVGYVPEHEKIANVILAVPCLNEKAFRERTDKATNVYDHVGAIYEYGSKEA